MLFKSCNQYIFINYVFLLSVHTKIATMIDLRKLLRAQNYVYRVQHSDTCTQIMPKEVFVNREVPPQELVASTFLKADRYQLCWRVSSSQTNYVQRCEILVYLKDYTTPTLMYDLKQFPGIQRCE